MLYTRSGTQGGAISKYDSFVTGTDPLNSDLKSKPFFYQFTQIGNETYYHRIRSVVILNQAPFFSFGERNPPDPNTRNSILFSLPMFAKYAMFNSVRDIPYERLAIKMKPEYDNV